MRARLYLSALRLSRSLLAAASWSLLAAAQMPFSVPPPDAPELAARGRFPVGVRTLHVVHPNQPDILNFDAASGKAPLYNRPLTLEVWYPAVLAPGQQEQTTYISAMPGFSEAGTLPAGTREPATFEIAGKALRDAPPASGARFPLVVVSHGYPGSRTFLTYLTENLASKGYIVVAIDHTDSVFGDVKNFTSTLLNRASDQLFTVEAMRKLAAQPGHFLAGLVDERNVAVVGYSMGGYGALIAAGAGLSARSPLGHFVPGNYLADWSAGSPKYQSVDRTAIKAIVAIAPWGEQPPYSAWDATALSAIHVPSLFIGGDQDDVADFQNGIRPAFEGAVNSQRYLLVYHDARHNTGGNPSPPGILLSYESLQAFDEPVWRKDRITAINQHFVTAFLDLYLKGKEAEKRYLQLPVTSSNDGVWTVPEGNRNGGAFSAGIDAQGHPFWTGFQRRWALGLQLFARAPDASNTRQP